MIRLYHTWSMNNIIIQCHVVSLLFKGLVITIIKLPLLIIIFDLLKVHLLGSYTMAIGVFNNCWLLTLSIQPTCINFASLLQCLYSTTAAWWSTQMHKEYPHSTIYVIIERGVVLDTTYKCPLLPIFVPCIQNFVPMISAITVVCRHQPDFGKLLLSLVIIWKVGLGNNK